MGGCHRSDETGGVHWLEGERQWRHELVNIEPQCSTPNYWTNLRGGIWYSVVLMETAVWTHAKGGRESLGRGECVGELAIEGAMQRDDEQGLASVPQRG